MSLSKLTNNLRKIIEDIDTRLYDVPIKSDKWRNLYVSKNNGSKLGYNIYTSEEEALVEYKRCKNAPGNKWEWNNNTAIKKSETVCFQIPWKE